MTLFEWQSRFDLGLPQVDDQHRGLIELMNRLYEQEATGAPRQVRASTLNQLVARTRLHFGDEEAFMASFGYADLAIHKSVHERLLAQLDDHVRAFAAGDGAVPPELFSFLKLWLTSHICGIDTKYAAVAPKAAARY